jgi:GTP-binding protein
METQPKLTPTMALVGRTNVGKSTLFNRLIEKRKAITSPLEGTTQDINFDHCHWRDQIITVIDTAGLDLTSKNATEDNIKRQADLAMQKAAVIIMLVDVREPPLPQDLALAKKLQKSDKKILLVANKADNPSLRRRAAGKEWLQLGLGTPLVVSAANGSGVGDMLDEVLKFLHEVGLTSRPIPEPDVRIAIIGRPNVGKSSLLNALAGEERVIVSEVPHTTREPQDTLLSYTEVDGTEHNILVVDTVGIRKKAKVKGGLEHLGISLSVNELERADVAFLLIDAETGVDAQERKLAGLIERKNIGVLVVINKWDLANVRDLGDGDDFRKYVIAELPFLKFAPTAFISAKTGYRVNKLLQLAIDIARQRQRELTTDQLDSFVEKLKKKHHAIISGGKDGNRPKIHGIRQIGSKPPTFMVVANKRENIHPNFLKFIENRLREEFGFSGTPIAVVSREIRAKAKK